MKKRTSLFILLIFAITILFSFSFATVPDDGFNRYKTITSKYYISPNNSLYQYVDWVEDTELSMKRGTISPRKIMDDVVVVETPNTISSSDGPVFFIKKDGSLWAFGSNYNSVLGVGKKMSDYSQEWVTDIGMQIKPYEPTPVKVMDNVQGVSISEKGSLILKNDGSVWFCGIPTFDKAYISGNAQYDNENGAIITPVKILDGYKFVEIADDRGYVIDYKGDLYAWGNNEYGNLGDGTTQVRKNLVKIDSNVHYVDTSYLTTIYLKTDNTLWSIYEANFNKNPSKTPIQIMSFIKYATFGKIPKLHYTNRIENGVFLYNGILGIALDNSINMKYYNYDGDSLCYYLELAKFHNIIDNISGYDAGYTMLVDKYGVIYQIDIDSYYSGKYTLDENSNHMYKSNKTGYIDRYPITPRNFSSGVKLSTDYTKINSTSTGTSTPIQKPYKLSDDKAFGSMVTKLNGIEYIMLDDGLHMSWNPFTSQSIVGYRVFKIDQAKNTRTSISDFYFKEPRAIADKLEAGKTYEFEVYGVRAEASAATNYQEILTEGIYAITVKVPANYSNNQTGKSANMIILKLKNSVMNVDGKTVEIDPGRGTMPIVENGRTFVPIRSIVEAVGGSIEWNDKEQKTTIRARGNVMELWVGKFDITINGKKDKMDVSPFTRDGRTFVPIRFVGENMKATVDWVNSTEEIVIKFNK